MRSDNSVSGNFSGVAVHVTDSTVLTSALAMLPSRGQREAPHRLRPHLPERDGPQPGGEYGGLRPTIPVMMRARLQASLRFR